MVTVAHIVEKIMEKKPFIQEALSAGLINNAALATSLQPEIDKELGTKTTFSAVNMAVRRLAEKLESKEVKRPSFDKNTDINIKSNLVTINIRKQDDILEAISKLYGLVDYAKGDFLTVTHGIHEVLIITNARYKDATLDIIPVETIKNVTENISSLTMGLPEDAINNPGFFFLITRILTWENINIIEIVSTYSEITCFVSEDDVPRAFTALKKMIKN